MKVSKFHATYTMGNKFSIVDVFREARELLAEIVRANKKGIIEEAGDTSTYIQIWLYNHFKIDSELWKISKWSFNKYHNRRIVWNRIHKKVGLRGLNYCANYKKKEKVVNYLRTHKIPEKKIEEAYEEIVRPLLIQKNL